MEDLIKRLRERDALVQDLLSAVPSVRSAIGPEIDAWQADFGEPPTADYVFGGLLVPEVVRLAAMLPESSAATLLASVYSYIDDLLASSSEAIRNVAEASFAEQLASHPGTIEKSAELMGERLLAAVRR